MTNLARLARLDLVIVTFLVTFRGEPAFAAEPNPSKLLDQYRQFALQHDGDAANGRRLFADEQRLACSKCHSIDGTGQKAGPDLFAAGDQFPRQYLIEAVLQPSALVAVGYSTTVVATKSGDEFQGVLKQATESWVELAGADGMRTRIPKSDIEQQRGSTLSLMPEGLYAGLTLQEFADLIEYLVILKEPSQSAVNQKGMPDDISVISPPVSLRPFLQAPLSLTNYAHTRIGRRIQSGLVWFGQVPTNPNVFLAADQGGIIWRIDKTSSSENVTLFEDLREEVFSARGPNGLLGLAFHPQFRKNRKYYLKYQIFEQDEIATVLVERRFRTGSPTDSREPSRRLLKIPSGAEHHNGGCIQFGPDGFLYLGMGDSAPNHDPQGHGQDLHLLLGKMLRIDVDHSSEALPYAIPTDNPFRGRSDARPEIWALGFREPWRFSFDPLTGDLWVADLGQERGDELDIVRAGENYGWNVYQGFELFSPQYRDATRIYTAPFFAIRRKHGSAIMGGYVYRGNPKSPFYGAYIFGDQVSKRVWALTQENRSLKSVQQIATCPESITDFSTDQNGEIYIVGYEGMIYQVDLSNGKLSQ